MQTNTLAQHETKVESCMEEITLVLVLEVDVRALQDGSF